jgi:hypothetical protein
VTRIISFALFDISRKVFWPTRYGGLFLSVFGELGRGL